jgi:hypothetical protein
MKEKKPEIVGQQEVITSKVRAYKFSAYSGTMNE